MQPIEVTLALPAEVFRSVERSADGAGMSVAQYLADVVRSRIRSDEDELAIEGYQALAEETLEFAASAMATVRETWPQWDEIPAHRSKRAVTSRPPARGTCRAEVLDAANAVMERNNSDRFSMREIVDEMRHRGSKYAESTIRTHIGSRMCANANANHGSVSNDLERLEHGWYRLARSAPGRVGGSDE